jgi:dTDP-4-amino-4,6-dideoxygalactose transaminase
MPAFSHLGYKDLEYTEIIGARYLGLPMFRDISLEFIEEISKVLASCLERDS